jgi:16S rRNA (cytidine1402-2'-O)-methyltransferase
MGESTQGGAVVRTADRRPGERRPPAPGILYVVATPIGNLEDITLRALRVLAEVDLIAAEDTRRTRGLLAHHRIRTPLVSYYDAIEARRVPQLLARLGRGERIALVSDAGTPGISDPGHRLLAAAARAGIAVVPVPGPSALTTALTVAGLPTDRVAFEGFLPARGAARRRRLETLRREPRTIVLFEAPHRLGRTLADLLEALGDRPAVLARELTKRFEEVRRGTLASLAHGVAAHGVRGEVALVIGGWPETDGDAGSGADLDTRILRAFEAAAAAGGSVRDVVDRVAGEVGGRRREIYRRALALSAGRSRP